MAELDKPVLAATAGWLREHADIPADDNAVGGLSGRGFLYQYSFPNLGKTSESG